MRHARSILSATSIAIILSGCTSWMMPYQSDFSCPRGQGDGVCGSMTEIYQKSLEKEGNVTSKRLRGDSTGMATLTTADTESEQVIYALYRKQKLADELNKAQEERLAKLEMQAKLLIAGNTSLANKLNNFPARQEPTIIVQPPLPLPSEHKCEVVTAEQPEKHKVAMKKTSVKVDSKPQKCRVGDTCELIRIETANMREKPCSCSKILAVFKKGDTFNPTAKQGIWLKDERGWISSLFLKRVDSNISGAHQ